MNASEFAHSVHKFLAFLNYSFALLAPNLKMLPPGFSGRGTENEVGLCSTPFEPESEAREASMIVRTTLREHRELYQHIGIYKLYFR